MTASNITVTAQSLSTGSYAANDVFAPDEKEIAGAREIIDAFEEAKAQGKGVVVVKGRLVENLHVEEAQRQLALAEAIAAISS